MAVEAFRDLALARLSLPVPEFHSRWLSGQLEAVSREWDFPDVHALIDELWAQHPDTELWKSVIHSVTVHETYWLRNGKNLAQALKAFGSTLPRLRVLSLGCAYGQEPYAAYLLAREFHPGADIEVTGVDLSAVCVDRARAGQFPLTADFNLIEEYLRSDDGIKANGYFEFSEAIRQRLHFRTGNVLDPGVAGPDPYDLILCQNCLTYYEEGVREKVAAHLADSLDAGGLLVFAGAELLGTRPRGVVPLSDEWAQIFVKEF